MTKKKRRKGTAMSESNETAAPTSGEAAAAPAEAAAPTPAATASDAAASEPSLVTKLKTHPKVQQALSVAKEHPLGAVVGVAAAAAFVEVELTVAFLTGIGAATLLVAKNGPQARDQIISVSKQAVAKAKQSVQKRRQPASAEAAPPPPAP
jgi:hypothetical protein